MLKKTHSLGLSGYTFYTVLYWFRCIGTELFSLNLSTLIVTCWFVSIRISAGCSFQFVIL